MYLGERHILADRGAFTMRHGLDPHWQRLAYQFMVNAVRTQPGDQLSRSNIVAQRPQVVGEACAAKAEGIGGFPFLVDSGAAVINNTVGKLSADGIKALGEARSWADEDHAGRHPRG